MTIMDVLRQVIEPLRNLKMSSAGGDSPKINFVKEFPEITYQDFDEIIRNEVKRILDEEKAQKPDDFLEEEAGTEGIVSESGVAGGINKGIGLAKNPMSAMGMILPFLPHAVLISLAISLAPMIIDALKAPGMPMDTRFKRVMEDEENAFLDRQVQWNTQIGARQLIVQSKAGFIMANGAQNENTLRQIREGDQSIRKANIDFTDHARSLF